VNLFKTVVVCVAVVAICGCDRSQPKPPVATSPTPPATTNNPTHVELPESASAIGMDFKLIPAGTFIMGERDKPHEVTLTQPFKMGVHEVTQAQYQQVMGNNPSEFKGANNPVEMVSWEDAVKFCRKLSALPAEKAAGNVYRLPTEAEWEYACRAGTTTKYSFGDDESDLADYAWYGDNSGSKTHPAGVKQPNAWGLYDMHGNVWEWCQDWYGDYSSGAVRDPTGPSSGSSRVIRGGSWSFTAEFCRSASRDWYLPSSRNYSFGFRVSLSPSGK
jgi:formylglycine-generating enzyme required for sulfatase activity